MTLLLPLLFAAGPLAATPAFDVSDWASVLERFVDERGLVDYTALAADRAALDRFLATIASVGPESRPELFAGDEARLGYYVDAYNALVFAGVLARGPERDSVWKGGLVSGYAFFVKARYRLDGRELSLKELEDDVIRARFADPRIHAALNCASLGCPRLPRAPFSGGDVGAKLEAAMREMAAGERHVQVDAAKRRVTLSKIFDWFEGDFLAFERRQGKPRPTILDAIDRWRPAEQAIPRGFRVAYAEYDKRLNDARRHGSPASPGGSR